MTDVIKKWEAILAKDLPNDIVYSRKVMIEMLTDFKQLHKPDVGRSLPFVTWLFTNYQMFHDKWIKLTGNGNRENPYTTRQPMLTWDEVVKEYELRQ